MKTLLFILLLYFCLNSFAQCPNVAQLEGGTGGTFGQTDLNCSISNGAENLHIDGYVVWDGATMDFSLNSAYIDLGATLVIQSGVVDFTDTPLNVYGVLIIEAGATIITNGPLRAQPGGAITIRGDASSQSTLDIYAGGTVTVESTGTVTTTGAGDNEVYGTLNLYGSMTTSGDINVDGGSVTVYNSGSVSLGDNSGDGLYVYGGGDFTVDEGGKVDVLGDIEGGEEGVGASGQATIIINGDLTVGDDLIIFNTEPDDSFLGGAGNITVQGSFADAECPDNGGDNGGDFCFCAGGGELCNSLLPVELTMFEARSFQNRVRITWETATELNNDFFTVYHSNDGVSFRPIAKIRGNGTTSVPQSYVYEQSNVPGGSNYYKLRQTDYDGQWTESQVVLVEQKIVLNGFSIFPNPISTGQTLNVYLNDSPFLPELVELIVLDISGRKIGELSAGLKSGSHYCCDIRNLNTDNQVLIVKLKDNPEVQSKLFLKDHN